MESEKNATTTDADMNETISPKKSAAERWSNATGRLSVGISFATMLLILYNVLLFLHPDSTRMGAFVIYFIVVLICGYLCISNVLRGLSRLATCFEAGGQRSLFIIRGGFLLCVAGVALQLVVAYSYQRGVLDAVNWKPILLGSVLYMLSAIVAVVGFVALSTSHGMHPEGSRGALHLAWVSVFLACCSIVFGYALQTGMVVKIVSVVLNLVATYFFYINWRRILVWSALPGETVSADSLTDNNDNTVTHTTADSSNDTNTSADSEHTATHTTADSKDDAANQSEQHTSAETPKSNS